MLGKRSKAALGVSLKAAAAARPDRRAQREAKAERLMQFMANRSFSRASNTVARDQLRGIDTDLTLAAGSVLNTVNTNGAAFGLNNIQTGSGYFNRLGDKARMKSLRMVISGQCTIAVTAGGDVGANTMRMVVVRHKTPAGAAIPAFDDIFGETNDAGTVSTTFLDKVQFRRTSQFQILCDKVVVMNPQGNTSAAAGDIETLNFYLDEFINLKGMETQYLTTTNPAVYTDIQTGGLLVYFRANLNAAATSEFIIDNRSYARLRFYA